MSWLIWGHDIFLETLLGRMNTGNPVLAVIRRHPKSAIFTAIYFAVWIFAACVLYSSRNESCGAGSGGLTVMLMLFSAIYIVSLLIKLILGPNRKFFTVLLIVLLAVPMLIQFLLKLII